MLATGAQDPSRYRTASAEMANVSAALTLTGQLSAAASRDVAFQVQGTVDEVFVEIGQEVAAGEELATLDPTELLAAVDSAEDALMQAKQVLEENLVAQADPTSSTTAAAPTPAPDNSGEGQTTTRSSTPSTTAAQNDSSAAQPTPESPNQSTSSNSTAITKAQQALLAHLDVAASAQEQSQLAVLTAQQTCEPFQSASLSPDETPQPVVPSTSPSVVPSTEASATPSTPKPSTEPSETPTSEASETPTSEASETPTREPSLPEGDGAPSSEATNVAISVGDDHESDNELSGVQEQLQACQEALDEASRTQQSTADAQGEVERLANVLDDAVSSSEIHDSTANPDSQGDRTPPEQQAGTSVSSPNPESSTSAREQPVSPEEALERTSPAQPQDAQAKAITAEQILADHATVALMENQVAVAERDLTFATLTSPLEGTVVAVGLMAGVTSEGTITVESDSGYVVDLTVPLSNIDQVDVGQSVDVSLPAFGDAYEGTVATVGVLNQSQTTTPAYTVTIAVDAGDDQPRIGATIHASVHVAEAKTALTVPTSAVRGLGSDSRVTMLVDGTAQDAIVTIGTVGAERTEILHGVEEGDIVVLADNQAVSESDTSVLDTPPGGAGRQGSGARDN